MIFINKEVYRMLIRSPKELALLVINQRKKLKLSQASVGQLVGLKQTTVSAFENKPASTKLDTLFLILSAVNLDMNILAKNQKIVKEKGWQKEW